MSPTSTETISSTIWRKLSLEKRNGLANLIKKISSAYFSLYIPLLFLSIVKVIVYYLQYSYTATSSFMSIFGYRNKWYRPFRKIKLFSFQSYDSKIFFSRVWLLYKSLISLYCITAHCNSLELYSLMYLCWTTAQFNCCTRTQCSSSGYQIFVYFSKLEIIMLYDGNILIKILYLYLYLYIYIYVSQDI